MKWLGRSSAESQDPGSGMGNTADKWERFRHVLMLWTVNENGDVAGRLCMGDGFPFVARWKTRLLLLSSAVVLSDAQSILFVICRRF